VLKQVLEKQLSERAALNLALASAVISRALYSAVEVLVFSTCVF
jgi:hypothetical protein